MGIKEAYIPRQGDIVLVNLNPTIDKEKSGQRPALVVSIDQIAKYSNFVWIVPITTGNYDFLTHIKLDKKTETQGTIQLEQLRSVDYVKRNVKFHERLSDTLLAEVIEMIREIV